MSSADQTTSDKYDLDAFANTRLRDFIPGAADLRGTMEFLAEPRSVARNVARRFTDGTWEDLTRYTVAEILNWPNVGEIKMHAMIGLVAACAADTAMGRSVTSTGSWNSPLDNPEVRDSLEMLAAWGASQGCVDLIDTIVKAGALEATGEVFPHLQQIRRVDLNQLSGPARWAFDPVGLIQKFIDELDERDCAILEHRLATESHNKLTLEQLGHQFDVTREWIRQLADALLQRITDLESLHEYQPVFDLVSQIRSDTGIACPVDLAPDEILVAEDSLVDELLAHIAGPYQLVDGWFMRDGHDSPDKVSRAAFNEIADDGIASTADLNDSLGRAGVIAEAIEPVIDHNKELHVVGESVIDYKGGALVRAQRWLRHLGTSQTVEELHGHINDGGSIRTLSNGLSDDSRFSRVGKSRFALPEWGEETYTGIVPAMIDAIEGNNGFAITKALGFDLKERFGVSPNSVQILANTHPAFIEEGPKVRMRRFDEPYVVTQRLVTSRECFSIDGAWSLRVPVDHDVLRGSGRQIPESFADHLGIRPGYTTTVSLDLANISLGWQQFPSLGSIRSSVLGIGGQTDDIVFIQRWGAAGLILKLVRRIDLDTASLTERICLLVGASAADSAEWQRSLAGALGFGVLVATPLPEIQERLVQRKDQELLDLLQRAAESR